MGFRRGTKYKRSSYTLDDSVGIVQDGKLISWLRSESTSLGMTYHPSDYVNHFSLLISAMHILLSCNISCHDLTTAEEFLLAFYNQVPDLYPDNIFSKFAYYHTFMPFSATIGSSLGIFHFWI